MRIVSCFAVWGLLVLATQALAANPVFQSLYTAYDVVPKPSAATLGDFNGDGIRDVALVSQSPSAITVRLGVGDGSFAAPDTLLAPSLAFFLSSGDLNADGRDDLIANGGDGDTLSVLLSLPGGGFTLRMNVGSGTGYSVVADLTDDEKNDIVVAASPNLVRIYPGDGLGGFGAPVTLTYTGATQWWPLVGDVNHDGKPDLVTSVSDGAGGYDTITRFNLGAGSFSADVRSIGAAGSLLVDFDEDGYLDLLADLVSNQNGYPLSSATYSKGHADGTFDPETVFDADIYGGTVGDVDGDGHLDLVCHYGPNQYPNPSITMFKIFRGHGDGTVDPGVTVPTGVAILWEGVDDLNHDGHADLISFAYDQSQLYVHLGRAGGGFGNASSYAVGPAPSALALGELTGDGRCDVAVVEAGSPGVRVLPNVGSGRLGASTLLPTPAGVSAVEIADLNGDSARDLVSANGSSNNVSVFLGSAGGVFAPRTDYPVPAAASRVTLGDLNGDGYADVAALCGNSISVWLSSASGVLGTRADLALPGTYLNLTIARVDADPYPDVLVAAATRVSFFPGSPTGALGLRVDVNFGTGSGSVLADFGDLNGDGFVDVVATGGTARACYVRLGDGSGGFTAVPAANGGRAMHGQAIGDLNEDGMADLASANFYSGCVGLILGAGTGQFTRDYVSYGSGSYAIDARLADMDGDGHLDIVCANQYSNDVTVMLNRTPGLATVDPAAPVESALRFGRVGPVPARGTLHASFSLPVPGHAALELLDVAGRRVQRTELGELAAGPHSVDFARVASQRAGVYWLRLVQGRTAASTRVVFVD